MPHHPLLCAVEAHAVVHEMRRIPLAQEAESAVVFLEKKRPVALLSATRGLCLRLVKGLHWCLVLELWECSSRFCGVVSFASC